MVRKCYFIHIHTRNHIRPSENLPLLATTVTTYCQRIVHFLPPHVTPSPSNTNPALQKHVATLSIVVQPPLVLSHAKAEPAQGSSTLESKTEDFSSTLI